MFFHHFFDEKCPLKNHFYTVLVILIKATDGFACLTIFAK